MVAKISKALANVALVVTIKLCREATVKGLASPKSKTLNPSLAHQIFYQAE